MKRARPALSAHAALALSTVALVTSGLLTAACSSDKLATSNPDSTPSPASEDASVRPGTDAGVAPVDANAAPDTAAPACAVVPVTVCPDSGVPTYSDVAPIFQNRCNGCHLGLDGGPWPLDDYEPIADWQGEVRASFLNCSMPPADSGVTVPESETQTVLTWIKCGLPK